MFFNKYLNKLSLHLQRIFSFWQLPLAIIVTEIAMLWYGRSVFIHGWEIIGPAEGTRWMYQYGLFEAIKNAFWNSRHYFYQTSLNSVIYTILPGLLEMVTPWLFWSQVTSLFIFLIGIALIIVNTDLPKSVFLWALAASPGIISYSILGGTVISSIIPFALTITWIQRSRDSKSNIRCFFIDIAILAFATEFAFQSYVFSKTFFIIPIAASIFCSNINKLRRVTWIIGGSLACYLLYVLPTKNGGDVALTDALNNLLSSPYNAISNLSTELFFGSFLGNPLIFLLGIIAVIFIKKDRWFWRMIVGLQIGIGLLLAADPLNLRPRRVIVLAFLCTLVISSYWAEINKARVKNLIAFVLLMGVCWSLNLSAGFAINPGKDISLPFTSSQTDFLIFKQFILNSDVIVNNVKANPQVKHFILYGYDYQRENTTNPSGLPEMLYLKLGPDLFRQQVLLFSDQLCRYSCVPSIATSELFANASKEKRFFIYVHADSLAKIPSLSKIFSEYKIKKLNLELTNFEAFYAEAH